MTEPGMAPPPRTAALVLTTREGAIWGALPALPIATPWWQDVAPVVEAVRARHGIEVTILRLLAAELAAPPGGAVTYLAEASAPIDATTWSGEIGEHPLRQSWARPGGPAADLAWAQARLTELGLLPGAPPVQIRTWNLSSLWRLPCHTGAVWLKVVPPFFAHEGAILTHLAGGPVPRLLAHDGVRMLLAEAPGEDLYFPRLDQMLAMIDILVELQRAHLGRAGKLLALGLADARAEALARAITALAQRRAGDMPGHERRLAAFIDGLPSRLAALAEAGPGETLVHGDFHPGNFRGDDQALTLLDWGDSAVGHPLLDMSAFLSVVPEGERAAVRAHWRTRWGQAAPAMDFDRAADLIAPLDAAHRAAIFQGFLDAIEPSEHPYHAADPVFWLTRALDLAAGDDR